MKSPQPNTDSDQVSGNGEIDEEQLEDEEGGGTGGNDADENLNENSGPRSNQVIESELKEMMVFLKTQLKKEMGQMGLDVKDNRIKTWKHRLEELTTDLDVPAETVVAVVGDTGHGKSTLINSLIGSPVVAESSMQACTNVPIELRFAKKPDTCKAVIEYLKPHEWEKELRSLIVDVQDGDKENEKVRKSARAKFLAVYPKSELPSSEKDLKPYLSTTICAQNLGSISEFNCQYPEELQSKLQGVLNNKDALGKPDFQVWPLIKNVRVEICASVLQRGITLVDLPGLRDVNQARTRVTDRYLEGASTLLLVARQDRAVSSETIDELLDRYLKSKLSNGVIESATFVTTMADTIRDLGPFTGSEKLMLEWGELEREKNGVKEKRKILRELEQKKGMTPHIPSSSPSSTLGKRPLSPNPSLRTSKTLKTSGGDRKASIRDTAVESSTTPSESSLKEELVGSQARLHQISQEEKRLRAISRNEKCRQKLCELFKEKIQQMVQDLEITASDAEPNQIHIDIFCTSAAAFLDMSKHGDDDPEEIQSSDMFMRENDTEIPKLRTHIQQMGHKNQRHKLESIGRQFRHLLSEIELSLDSHDQPLKEAEALRTIYSKSSNKFFQEATLSIKENRLLIQKKVTALQECIQTGHATAKIKGAETIRPVDGTSMRANTFKAIMAREGTFQNSRVDVDYNGTLADLVVRQIQGKYIATFRRPERLVKGLQTTLRKSLDNFLEAFERTAEDDIGTGESERLKKVTFEVKNQILEALQKNETTARGSIGDGSKETQGPKTVQGIIRTSIEENLEPVYNEAVTERGEGMYKRMQQIFFGHLESYDEKNPFSESEHNISNRVSEIHASIEHGLDRLQSDIRSDTDRIFATLWPLFNSTPQEDYAEYHRRRLALQMVKNQMEVLKKMDAEIQQPFLLDTSD